MKNILILSLCAILPAVVLLPSTEVQAQFTTLGGNQGENAVAYCWRNQADYYFCYGPVQRTSSGEELDLALQYSGCTDPNPQEYWPSASGVRNGVWYICQGRKMESYDNSEERIRQWVSER